MIDPTNITNYNLSTKELQEVILWWILAAGKNGLTASKCLESLLSSWRKDSPFETIIYIHSKTNLGLEMKNHGIGCYNNKAKSFLDLIDKNLDLKNCTLEELESVYGLGPKTARCFLLHSRPNQQYAGLDTHCLKYLRDLGFKVPKVTPTGKTYRILEDIFLQIVKISKMTSSELDLLIWNVYSGNDKNKKSKELLFSFKNQLDFIV
jgi:thermostable 8-oxoguanine DNA glycosylase